MNFQHDYQGILRGLSKNHLPLWLIIIIFWTKKVTTGIAGELIIWQLLDRLSCDRSNKADLVN